MVDDCLLFAERQKEEEEANLQPKLDENKNIFVRVLCAGFTYVTKRQQK